MWKNKKKYPIVDEGLYILAANLSTNLILNIQFWRFSDDDMSFTSISDEFEYFNSTSFHENKEDFLKSIFSFKDEKCTIDIFSLEGKDISLKTGLYGLVRPNGEFICPIVKDEAIFYLRIPSDSTLFGDYLRNEELIHIPSSKRLKIFKRDKFRCKLCTVSPATHEDIELVIDHIYPTSFGGSNH